MKALRAISAADAAAGAAAVIVLAAAPLVTSSTYWIGILTIFLCYGLWAAGWDFMSGLTGRENFGYALFAGAGAYTAGFLNTVWGIDPWWSFPAAALAAVAFSLVIGFPTLKLRGPYFALAMLSAATAMEHLTVIFSSETGGYDGLHGIEPVLDSVQHGYWLTLGVLVLAVLGLKLLALSPIGIVLRAIQGDETACQASGINVTFYKMLALAISAAVAGVGGALYAHSQLQVGPDMFAITLTINIIMMVYVGGMGTIYGPVGGAILLSLLAESLRGFGDFRLWVYTVILLLIIYFLPRGLVAPAWTWLRHRLRSGAGRDAATSP